MLYTNFDTDEYYESDNDLFKKDTPRELEILEDNDGVDEFGKQIIRRIPCCPSCAKSIYDLYANYCSKCGQHIKR